MNVVSENDRVLFVPRLLHQFPLPPRRDGRQLVRPSLFSDLPCAKELVNGHEHRHRNQQKPESRFDNLLVPDEPGILGDHGNEQVRH